jgi:type I restriction enzyme M protein
MFLAPFDLSTEVGLFLDASFVASADLHTEPGLMHPDSPGGRTKVTESSSAKPTRVPRSPYPETGGPLWRDGSWVWAPLKRAWLQAKPEEVVRQEYVWRLHSQYGFALEQMAQERTMQTGRGSSRADIVIAADIDSLSANRDYRVAVETKAENVTIRLEDYGQGESYARAVGAEFLVLHNNKETSFFRLVPGAPGERIEITTIPRSTELSDRRRLEEIRRATKAFTRDEFQRLLYECHSILRDNHKMDPGAAFDEISKILFIKMAFERTERSEVFTTQRLIEIARANLIDDQDDVSILERLFETTKRYYTTDQLFADGETLRVSMATFRRIVSLLERFNLSDSGEDVKGIAFEKFLGETFRGQLGQFFTPRPIVEFMVEMLDPMEGELICDPASGTGGFLIRAFEHVRGQIEADVQTLKAAMRQDLEKEAAASGWSEDELTSRIEAGITALNRDLDPKIEQSRLYALSHDCIFGLDAEPRAARTSKMNMIMHGDGHGGIHYHDGLVDVNGIFPGRFDVVVTNPPFGSAVGADQIIGATEQTKVEDDPKVRQDLGKLHGAEWIARNTLLLDSVHARRPILALFDIGRDPIAGPMSTSRVRPSRSSESLFLERCLALLKPGGRLGIVLPDGVLNNPSAGWLRDYVRGRAKLLAVVSVPQEVFASAKATVKPSLVFLQRFTEAEARLYEAALRDAVARMSEEAQGGPPVLHKTDTPPTPGGLQEAMRTKLGKRARNAGRLRELVDEQFEFPIFFAEASSAGITATGDTGPDVANDLPAIAAEYRRYLADPRSYVGVGSPDAAPTPPGASDPSDAA